MTREPSETTSTDERRRELMVERQLRHRGIHDERVLAAMRHVPRHRFLPRELWEDAYADGALPIGEGQTMSQPWIVAFMSEMLELVGGETVLEVGTGSGYGAAVLSRLCAKVVTIERHEALAVRARATLAELGYDNVDVRTGDGSAGVPELAPFDGIAVTATAEDAPPRALLQQLKPRAALVIPIRRGRDERLVRIRDGREEPLVPVRFVPLIGP
jgi:protein-L-isoaspartate(D-aspartate) O-methyltransferase